MKRELTNQELLDRYIHSVKMALPPDQTHDIAAEIRSILQSLAEDRAEELGRDLRPDEMSAILKQYGHPLSVGNRYRDKPGRGLISPELFPLYWFTLRALFGVWLTIRVIVTVFEFQGAATAGSILLRFGRDVLLAGLIIYAGVTVLFAVWEYLEFKYRYSAKWKPESLPPVPRPMRQPPRPRPMVGIISGITWLLFWGMALFLPGMYWVWGGRGVFSSSETLYATRLPLFLLILFGISQSWLNYTRFARAEWRRLLFTAFNVAGMVLAVFLLRAGDLLVAGPKWDPTQAKSLATLNHMLGGVLVLGAIFAALVCVKELVRYARRLGGGGQTADSTS